MANVVNAVCIPKLAMQLIDATTTARGRFRMVTMGGVVSFFADSFSAAVNSGSPTPWTG